MHKVYLVVISTLNQNIITTNVVYVCDSRVSSENEALGFVISNNKFDNIVTTDTSYLNDVLKNNYNLKIAE